MFYTDKWSYLHIPKCGGVNFKTRANVSKYHFPLHSDMGDKQRHLWQHEPIDYYNKLLPDLPPWITIIRNPYSRLLSWFFFVRMRREEHKEYVKKEYKKDIGMWPWDFEDFIIENALWKMSSHPKNKSPWIDFKRDGGQWQMNWTQSQHIGHNECITFRLEDQLPEMEDFVGFKFADTRHNSTPHNPWESYYTDDLKRIVYERYSEDFARLGYTP
ncbi:uncharacterized protein METZ01_LOCUS7568 [marine metagenome]|uniref:Sulfotransferase domain-containing protein n=1 Tax=marine metagenome TaxID=408172 RepID=A0A381NKR5_9ZZZZ